MSSFFIVVKLFIARACLRMSLCSQYVGHITIRLSKRWRKMVGRRDDI